MKKIIRTFIVVSFFMFTSCKDVIITEFDSFKWHRLEIISQNDSVYYNELLDDSFLEFNENNTGKLNFSIFLYF